MLIFYFTFCFCSSIFLDFIQISLVTSHILSFFMSYCNDFDNKNHSHMVDRYIQFSKSRKGAQSSLSSFSFSCFHFSFCLVVE